MKRLLALILAFAPMAMPRRADAQAERLGAAVNRAQADQMQCAKRECLEWYKGVSTPTGVFIVTRCVTSPRQQIELALAARMVARETSNAAWNELAVIAVASAFIHEPESYALVQASPSGAIAELDRRLDKGEYGGNLRPGGGKGHLTIAEKWSAQPQCVH